MNSTNSEDGAGEVAANLAEARARIALAAKAAGRDPASITLIAVGKAQSAARIDAALAAGQRTFGENYVQEALERWPERRAGAPGLELHMIGALQSNKAREVVRHFDVLHTVDRPKLAKALSSAMRAANRRIDCLVQVNTGEEPQKAGLPPGEVDRFVAACREEFDLPLKGLMAIPPAGDDVAPHAALLARIAARNGLPWLSVGMSADYETAVRFGATHVRVGSAIFGARPIKIG